MEDEYIWFIVRISTIKLVVEEGDVGVNGASGVR